MKKGIFMTKEPNHIPKIYDEESKKAIRQNYEISDTIYCKKQLNSEDFADVQAIFTTWGMEHFEVDEIKQYFPALKYVFYAAGSVQHFAKEFLECGVRIFSAADANAVPVAEYTFAQIVLANKGAYQATRKKNLSHYYANNYANKCKGNYKPIVGIIGVGKIGKMVIELLKNIDCEVWYYDPFLPEEVAKQFEITKKSLEEIFVGADCISNHLANKDELAGIFDYKLFSLMKDFATFINTGRGRQVVEKDLIKAMRKCKTRTALLDVTYPEPSRFYSALRRLKNVFLTPHIAGSTGEELARMGAFMAVASEKLESGESVYEVSLDMLKTMA